ncbi:MAG: DUF2490 domain-containing protein [Cyclobacteriaceae bacterium]
MKRLFFSASFFFISLSGFSQKTVEHQDLLWLKYSANYKFSDQWSLNYFIEDRNYTKDFRSNHFINSITAKRKLKNDWSLGLGYLYFILTLPQDPDVENTFTRPEHRPFQYLSYKQSLSQKWSFGLRYQLEQRFRQNSDAVGRLPGYNTEIRIRQKASLIYEISDKLDAALYDEIMIHFGENVSTNTFDQNRLSLGLNWQVMEKINLGMSYIHWYQQRGNGESYYQRDIISLAVNHQWN